MNRQNLSALALASTCLWLFSCDSQKVTGTMDETNASAARLLDTAGTPAAGANLLVFHPLDSTRTPVAAGVTLSDGSYSLPTVPDGMYQILARSAGRVAVLDSVYTSQGKLLVRTDTLRDPGSIYGIVEMVGDDNPASVEVSVLGSDILVANVNSEGSYRLDNLGTGTWTLKFSTSLSGYTNTYGTVRTTASTSVKMDTVVMNYIAIPPVAGLKAVYDTSTGNVHLTWTVPPWVKGVRDVEVLRVNSADTASPSLIGTSDSSGYSDPVYPWWPSGPAPYTPTTWLYNVRIRTEDNSLGKVAYTTVTTIDPAVIAPTYSLAALVRDSVKLLSDTVGVVLRVTDPKFALLSVSWMVPGLDSIPKVVVGRGRSLVDTVLIRLGSLDSTQLYSAATIDVVDSVGHHFEFHSRNPLDSIYWQVPNKVSDTVKTTDSLATDSTKTTDSLPTRIDSTGIQDSTVKDTVVSWRQGGKRSPVVAWTRVGLWTERGSLWARLESIRLRDEEDRLG